MNGSILPVIGFEKYDGGTGANGKAYGPGAQLQVLVPVREGRGQGSKTVSMRIPVDQAHKVETAFRKSNGELVLEFVVTRTEMREFAGKLETAIVEVELNTPAATKKVAG